MNESVDAKVARDEGVCTGTEYDLVIHLVPCLEREHEKADHWQLLIRLHGTGDLGEAIQPPHVETIETCMAEIVVKLEAFMAVGDAVAQVWDSLSGNDPRLDSMPADKPICQRGVEGCNCLLHGDNYMSERS